MRRNEYSFEVRLTFDKPVTDHTFLLRCLPACSDTQTVLEEKLDLDPEVHVTVSLDGFGNRIVCGTITGPHDHFCYHSRGIVEVDDSLRRPVPYSQKMIYAGSGELTKADARLSAAAGSLLLLTGGLSDREKADLLLGEVQNRMIYEPGLTDTHTSAARALELGRGVCQDFTHVYIVLARQIGLTARYCMGLASQEGQTHAWAEVLLDGIWQGYDPTRGCVCGENYVRLACGRDAADCPAEAGIMSGFARQKQMIQTSVTTVEVHEEQRKEEQRRQQRQQVQQ
ncbi:MAG TPA: hypothetical protein DEP00_01920 [Lachnospiraceae bacterium]|nr:hypothetical protein [Lachnospiraceae bacterium]